MEGETIYERVWKVVPTLRTYSKTFLLFLAHNNAHLQGYYAKRWFFESATGLCNRSIELAIAELVERGYITYVSPRDSDEPAFRITL